jgi:hypothetical protein
MEGAVVAREPNRKLTNRFTDKMMAVTVDFDVVPAGPGETTLTHTVTIDTKRIGKLFTPLINRQLPAQTQGAMSELKKLVEGA